MYIAYMHACTYLHTCMMILSCFKWCFAQIYVELKVRNSGPNNHHTFVSCHLHICVQWWFRVTVIQCRCVKLSYPGLTVTCARSFFFKVSSKFSRLHIVCCRPLTCFCVSWWPFTQHRCETCGFRYHPRCSYKVPTTCNYLDDDILAR